MKTAVITGASSGIGRATATRLVRLGYRVFDLSRSEVPQQGVQHIPCDVTRTETIREALRLVREHAGRIDLLLLCAGMGIAGAIEFTTEAEMHRQFDVNVYGPIHVLQATLPLMRSQEKRGRERGRIVFVSSMAAVFSIPFQSMYSASKAALNSYAFALRNELKAYDIRVSCVMPGDVHTNFKRTTDLTGSEVYPHMKQAIEQMIHDEEHGLTSDQVARRVVKACTCPSPKIFYRSDLLSSLECLLQRVCSHSFACWLVGKIYHA